jgi:hypothetical protein
MTAIDPVKITETPAHDLFAQHRAAEPRLASVKIEV